MSSPLQFSRSIAVIVVILATAAGASDARPPRRALPPQPQRIALPVVNTVTLPNAKLRGYGDVAATQTVYGLGGGRTASLLAIRCADADKARLVHAKYLSDIKLLGTIGAETLHPAGVAVPAVDIPDQGVVAAFRNGTAVYIAAAEDASSVSALLLAGPWMLKGAELAPSTTVPMYLDSWDKYGFNFYYWPGQTPRPKPGENWINWRDYNMLGEFEFAKKNNTGVVLWQNEDKFDFAEGMDNDNNWLFAAKAAENRHLPVVVNSCIGGATWLLDRYRNDTQWKMPGYCGAYYNAGDPGSAGTAQVAWSADEGLDAPLSIMQRTWSEYAKHPTTLEYLEPHGELRHNDHDILNEYGPAADKTFRDYLKALYGTTTAVSQRWYGKPDGIASWDAIHVPEVVHFLGYSTASLDLSGEWKVKYEDFASGTSGPTTPAPADWYASTSSDDSWGGVIAPNSDAQMFLPRRPAVFRRHFNVTSDWKAANPKAWLYVISLNKGNGEDAPVYLNGKQIASPRLSGEEYPLIVDVSSNLQVGDNVLALRLPRGFLGYKVYVTGKEPAQYPYLGDQLNAQWADFTRWNAAIHNRAIRRSMEAIRDVDPDRSIICMSPNSFIGEVSQLCQDYGGHFHDTGGLAGWWNDWGPMAMRGSDLPYSAEPGGPAPDLPTFKFFLGNWLTEGVNAIHYFIHIGDVYWNDDIRSWFESHPAIIGAFGKMHCPKAQVAMLMGDDAPNLDGWPWHRSATGYVPYQWNIPIHKEYHVDSVSPKDFKRAVAAGYKVIIDTNTDVMDQSFVSDIEAYVRQGGTFVTLGETGRHTAETADAWPISRLTGFKVGKITVHPNWKPMSFAPGEKVFDESKWDAGAFNSVGQYLVPSAPDAVPLMLWPSGETAIGMRRIGKGAIIDIGCNYQKAQLLPQILAYLNVERIPGFAESLMSTHEVSNNGLYDVYITVNQTHQNATSNLVFRGLDRPPYVIDIQSGEKFVPGTDGKVASVPYGPDDIRIFAAPRRRIGDAPLAWLTLQRNWWRGTTPPSRKVAPYVARFADCLNNGWKMKTLDDKDTADKSALAIPAFDDKSWPNANLGTWLFPEDFPTHHAIYRRKFDVPANWNNGEIDLYMMQWTGDATMGRARLWIDGAEVASSASMIVGQDITATLKAGTTHQITLELKGGTQVAGFQGNLWLYYMPKPVASIDLGGQWDASIDGLKWDRSVSLPGTWANIAAFKRTVMIPAQQGRSVMFWMDAPSMTDVIVNGRYVRRHHHRIGWRTYIDITPWIKFGQENVIQVPTSNADPRIGIRSMALNFFPAGSFR